VGGQNSLSFTNKSLLFEMVMSSYTITAEKETVLLTDNGMYPTTWSLLKTATGSNFIHCPALFSSVTFGVQVV